MALAQANHVRDLLTGLVEGLDAEIVGIQTSGDRWQGDLAILGGKGAFLKEIDRHLVMGGIDIAVHCMKDVPGDVPMPEGTTFAAYLPRDDVHDVVVFPTGSPYRSIVTCPPVQGSPPRPYGAKLSSCAPAPISTSTGSAATSTHGSPASTLNSDSTR
jgi:hydroxymethylbilane synthase